VCFGIDFFATRSSEETVEFVWPPDASLCVNSTCGYSRLLSSPFDQVFQKQRRWRRRGRLAGGYLSKDEFISYQRNLQLSKSVQLANGSKNGVLRLLMQWQRSIPNESEKVQPWSFSVLSLRWALSFYLPFLKRTATKCAEIYNARYSVFLVRFVRWRSRCCRPLGLLRLLSTRNNAVKLFLKLVHWKCRGFWLASKVREVSCVSEMRLSRGLTASE